MLVRVEKFFFPHALSLAWQGRRGKVELNLNFYVVLWWIWLFLRNACFLANETPREGWAEGRWKWAPGNCIVFRWWELELKLCNWAKTARQGSDFEEAISSWWCRNGEDTLPPIGWWNWILLSWLSFVRRYGIYFLSRLWSLVIVNYRTPTTLQSHSVTLGHTTVVEFVSSLIVFLLMQIISRFN